MLSSSIRRAVRTTSSTVPFPSVLLPTAIVGGSGSPASAKNGSLLEEHRRRAQHQRRYSSSSKPPVPPNDGSRPIDTSSSSSQAPAKSGVNSAKQKREGGKNNKDEHGRKVSAKSRQASSSSFLNLPSVPSTQDTPMQGKTTTVWDEQKKFSWDYANRMLQIFTSPRSSHSTAPSPSAPPCLPQATMTPSTQSLSRNPCPREGEPMCSTH